MRCCVVCGGFARVKSIDKMNLCSYCRFFFKEFRRGGVLPVNYDDFTPLTKAWILKELIEV